MSIFRISAIVLRQFYLIRGSLSRFFPLFAWVTVDMLLWGFLSRYLGSLVGGLNFVSLLLGAVLLWDFFIRIMQGVTLAFFEDVWTKNFLNLFSTPLLVSEYILGLVLCSILTSTIGVIFMVLIATLVFKLSFFHYGFMLIYFMLILFFFGIALGICGVALVLRLGPTAEWFIWPIPALLSPFIGVFYPLSVLPSWMRAISYLLPPAYVFEGLRDLLYIRPLNPLNLLFAFSLTLFYLFVAYLFFLKIYQSALRGGLLARYSAESLT